MLFNEGLGRGVHTLTVVVLLLSSACGEGGDSAGGDEAAAPAPTAMNEGSLGGTSTVPDDGVTPPNSEAGNADDEERGGQDSTTSPAPGTPSGANGEDPSAMTTAPPPDEDPPPSGTEMADQNEDTTGDVDDPAGDEMMGNEMMGDEGAELVGTGSDIAIDASSGCSGSATPPDGPQVMDVDGTERSYIVVLPEGYDPGTPHPLIFAFHGLGGSAELVSGNRFYFGFSATEGTPSIFVYPDGLETGNGAGWPNTDGRDVAFFDAMLSTMQENYCIDSARVFSTGHSYGGIMSHTLGCQRADVLRAIAPVAGASFGRGGDCTGPIAAWGAHGNPDNTVDYDSGLSAIQRVMEANGCDPDSATPIEPTDVCVSYACDAEYPVTWCEHDQDHDWPEFAAESIKAFFDSF